MDENSIQLIKNNYYKILENINQAALSSSRDPGQIKIVTVSKTRSIDVIKAALLAGIKDFGENYPEEAIGKIEEINDPLITWHMIGHIQSRKTKSVANNFNIVHSVDRLKIAKKLDDELCKINKTMPVLIEFNVSGEASKFGWAAWEPSTWDELRPDMEVLLSLKNTILAGMMTMPPLNTSENSRDYFVKLRKLQEYFSKLYGEDHFKELSMGTSHDYVIAVQEGATFVRIGEAILGKREYPNQS